MILKDVDIKKFPSKIYQDTDKCLEYFSNLDLKGDEEFINKFNQENPFYFHVYWYGNLDRKQLLCIKSYIVTQNLEKTKLIIWLDDLNGYSKKNIDKIPIHPNIEVKKYVPNELSKGTLFENKDFINITDTKLIKYRSDLARIMFLYHYGGIYYDLDLILLKDLLPFIHLEFCYQWSNINNRGNNAILCIQKESKYCIEIFKKYIKYVNDGNKFNITANSYIFNYNNDNNNDNDNKLIKLPCSIFDPVWILFDTKSNSKYSTLNNFDDFFKKTNENINKLGDLFNNMIYCYHWHSRTSYSIERDSYFDKLDRIII
jgi:hypothetical protein